MLSYRLAAPRQPNSRLCLQKGDNLPHHNVGLVLFAFLDGEAAAVALASDAATRRCAGPSALRSTSRRAASSLSDALTGSRSRSRMFDFLFIPTVYT